MSLRSRSEALHKTAAITAGTTVIVSAITQQVVNIYKLIVTCSATATFQIQDTANTVLSQNFSFGANGGSIVLDIPINLEPWWGTNPGLGIQFVTTGGTINYDVWYVQSP
jgi:hypothetical protein